MLVKMIITCNSCNTDFNVDEQHLHDGGRKVRCGICSNTWMVRQAEANTKPKDTHDDVSQDVTIRSPKKKKKHCSRGYRMYRCVNRIIIFILLLLVLVLFMLVNRESILENFPYMAPVYGIITIPDDRILDMLHHMKGIL